MASTLAGNLTIVGSVANLIVVEEARASGIQIGFFDYCGSACRSRSSRCSLAGQIGFFFRCEPERPAQRPHRLCDARW
jgi:hypothetical protein